MSGGSQNTTSTQTIPSQLVPYYNYALSKGEQLGSGPGPQYYPGQQVAGLSSQQQAGLSDINAASQNNGATNSALGANQLETSGALLNPNSNPYLTGMFNTAANQIQNRTASEFAGAGSNIANSAPVQADAMNNLATQLYGGAYNTGIQAMTGAQALEPGLAQTQYLPGQEQLQAGATTQEQLQNQINAQMQKYNYQQTLPYNQLSWYSSLLGQNASPFASSSSSSTMNNNTGLTALGGAASGAALGSTMGPWGTAGGALIGGLMGLI